MRKTILVLLSILISYSLFSQQNYTISGYVADKNTGERLSGATISETNSNSGTFCNDYGFYSYTANKGELTITYSFVGYKSLTKKFRLTGDSIINIELSPSITIDEVVVNADRMFTVENSTRQSTIKLQAKQIEKIPVILGEKDLIKVIQLLPGVQSGNEGTTGIFVRGGGPDQNLILLDGVPVYNVSHLFGFFSVFIPESISDVELIKGGFPARYGGRLSSVLDIHMKEGNQKQIAGNINVGLLSSRLTIEGPFKKDKASWIFSARRTYFDLLLRPLFTYTDGGYKTSEGYYFQDINSKINFPVNPKNKIFLSFYAGNDNFYSKTTNKTSLEESEAKDFFKWGNITSTLRWNKTYGGKLFSNATLMYGQFKYAIGNDSEWSELNDESGQKQTTYQGKDSNFDYDFYDPLIREEIPNNNQIEYLPKRNNVKMKVYHRLDLGINFYKKKKRGERIWTISIYNVYNRQNPYFYVYETKKTGERQIKQVSLLPCLPSFTYTFNFR